MNWPDEKYVKVYTRDTLTWKSWSWQARTVFLHLTRKLDGAGLIEVGRMDPVDALVLQLDLPREVVAAGLPEIIGSGTAEMVVAGMLVPNWIAAQESTKTEAQKKRDQRERVRDQRRLAQVSEIRQAPVPECPALSPAVPLQPSPAQPNHQPSPEKRAGKKPPAVAKDTDPRHAPLVKALVSAAPGYAFGPRDPGAVTALLAMGEPAEVEARWRRALAHKGYPTVRAIHELPDKWAHFAADQPRSSKAPLPPAANPHPVGEVPNAF